MNSKTLERTENTSSNTEPLKAAEQWAKDATETTRAPSGIDPAVIECFCDAATRLAVYGDHDSDKLAVEAFGGFQAAEALLTQAFADAINSDFGSVATYGEFIANPDGTIKVLKQGGIHGWTLMADGCLVEVKP